MRLVLPGFLSPRTRTARGLQVILLATTAYGLGLVALTMTAASSPTTYVALEDAVNMLATNATADAVPTVVSPVSEKFLMLRPDSAADRSRAQRQAAGLTSPRFKLVIKIYLEPAYALAWLVTTPPTIMAVRAPAAENANALDLDRTIETMKVSIRGYRAYTAMAWLAGQLGVHVWRWQAPVHLTHLQCDCQYDGVAEIDHDNTRINATARSTDEIAKPVPNDIQDGRAHHFPADFVMERMAGSPAWFGTFGAKWSNATDAQMLMPEAVFATAASPSLRHPFRVVLKP